MLYRIYCANDHVWYEAQIIDISHHNSKHLVKYTEDGVETWILLCDEKVRRLESLKCLSSLKTGTQFCTVWYVPNISGESFDEVIVQIDSWGLY